MAEQPADASKPRIVNKAETVRQKAEQLSNKPARKKGTLSRVFKAIFRPFRPLARPFIWFGRLKPVRIIGLIIWPRYFRNSWKELKQVTWPSRKDTVRLTVAVIVFSIIFGVLIAVVDYVLNKIFKQLILN